MPRVTRRDPARPVVLYTSRGLYADLMARLRLLAVREETTIEATVNRVLEAGLRVVEKGKK